MMSAQPIVPTRSGRCARVAISVCLWIVGTCRITGVVAGIAALAAWGLGYSDLGHILVLTWAVPVLLSAIVLVVGAWIRDRVVR